MIVRAGLFTDFSQVESLDVAWNDIDYYGATFSMSFEKFLKEFHVDSDGPAAADPVKRNIWSTFGILARYGVGTAAVKNMTDIFYSGDYSTDTQRVYNIQAFIAESVAF